MSIQYQAVVYTVLVFIEYQGVLSREQNAAWLPKNKEDNTPCKAVPINTSDVCFFLDASNVESQSDLKFDDTGSWKNSRVQRVDLALTPEGIAVLAEEDFQVYKFKRIYYNNSSALDLKKEVHLI